MRGTVIPTGTGMVTGITIIAEMRGLNG
jgi:hypothetical protein